MGFSSHNRSAILAKGRLKAGTMNDTEKRYAAHLDDLKRVGEVAWWKFESVRLRLAEGLSYTVDFFVMLANGDLEAHEVKGAWQDDARAKIKMAQELYPFRFIALKPVPASRGGGWEVEDFEHATAPLLPGMRLKADVPKPVKRQPRLANATNTETGKTPELLQQRVAAAMDRNDGQSSVKPASER